MLLSPSRLVKKRHSSINKLGVSSVPPWPISSLGPKRMAWACGLELDGTAWKQSTTRACKPTRRKKTIEECLLVQVTTTVLWRRAVRVRYPRRPVLVTAQNWGSAIAERWSSRDGDAPQKLAIKVPGAARRSLNSGCLVAYHSLQLER